MELTHFAPAERTPVKTLDKQAETFIDSPLLHHMLDAVPELFLVLNQQRQIVFANDAMLDLVGLDRKDLAFGLRPGELLGCIHASETDGGCGTTEFCRTCGAIHAILASLSGHKSVQECRITQNTGQSLDLQVWATPLDLSGEIYSIFAVKDISAEKRRRVLERIFFHDLLNTAGVVMSYADMLQYMDDDDDIKAALNDASRRLIDEIQAQRDLLAAESGELVIKLDLVDVYGLLHQLQHSYQNHVLAEDRSVVLKSDLEPVVFTSDQRLLGRVLGNMIKNALEACQPGETVTVGYVVEDGHIRFEVHNPNFMPRHVQLQVFQRSFSTKGGGRGLGTYSMRLLSEKYLRGKVDFITSVDDGTTFRATYPLE